MMGSMHVGDIFVSAIICLTFNVLCFFQLFSQAVDSLSYRQQPLNCGRFQAPMCCAKRIQQACPQLCTEPTTQAYCLGLKEQAKTVISARTHIPTWINSGSGKLEMYPYEFQTKQRFSVPHLLCPFSQTYGKISGQDSPIYPGQFPPFPVDSSATRSNCQESIDSFRPLDKTTLTVGTPTEPSSSSSNSGSQSSDNIHFNGPTTAFGMWDEVSSSRMLLRPPVAESIALPPYGIVLPPPETPEALGTPIPWNQPEQTSALTNDEKVSESFRNVHSADFTEEREKIQLKKPSKGSELVEVSPSDDTFAPNMEEENFDEEYKVINGEFPTLVTRDPKTSETTKTLYSPRTKVSTESPYFQSYNGNYGVPMDGIAKVGVRRSSALFSAEKNEINASLALSPKRTENQENSSPTLFRTTVWEAPAFTQPPMFFANKLSTVPKVQESFLSFKIQPSENNKPPKIDKFDLQNKDLPISESNQIKPKSNETRNAQEAFGEKLEFVIDQIFDENIKTRLFAISKPPKQKHFTPKPEDSTKTYSAEIYTSKLTTPPTTKIPMERTCNTFPNFTPCVGMEEANIRFLECGRQRALPFGCLSLCRYNTTQTEVKRAFDHAQCGIANVLPFLECASQGINNVECCKRRGVASKTGPQCEDFCNPGKGIPLGLQHLVCQNSIQDFLQCHHAGLKSK